MSLSMSMYATLWRPISCSQSLERLGTGMSNAELAVNPQLPSVGVNCVPHQAFPPCTMVIISDTLAWEYP